MDAQAATRCINRLAIVEQTIFITRHARNREPERGKFPLTAKQIFDCLRLGRVTEGPVPDIKAAGYWVCTVTRFRDGESHQCAVSFCPETRIIVITGYCYTKRRR